MNHADRSLSQWEPFFVEHEGIPADRDVGGLSPSMPTWKAARRCLAVRLGTVAYWFPRAAHACDEDVEYVHQLRVATRRAVATLRIFRLLLPGQLVDRLRDLLRQVRDATGEARDLDVLLERCTAAGDRFASLDDLVAWIGQRRRRAQSDVVAAEDAVLGPLLACTKEVLAHLRRCARTEKRGRRALNSTLKRRCRRPARRFLEALDGSLATDEHLHRFRIAGKKLRYTLEAIPTLGRNPRGGREYARLQAMQQELGNINDYVQIQSRLARWRDELSTADQEGDLERVPAPQLFEGLGVAADWARRDMQASFRKSWPKRELRAVAESISKGDVLS